MGDAGQRAILEWVELSGAPPAPAAAAPAEQAKPAEAPAESK